MCEKLIRLFLVLVSLAITFLLIEAGYRYYKYKKLESVYVNTFMYAPDNSDFSAEVGYRYKPGFKFSSSTARYSVNEHGHISNSSYPVEKPQNEFRILVIGDSFVANINNTVRWTELLEAKLNADPVWRNYVEGKFTRVINLGRDGISAVQFWPLFLHDGLKFGPDIVLVNFISDDINRREYFRGKLKGLSAAERKTYITNYVRKNILSTVPWWSLTSEIIADSIGKYLGLTPKTFARSARLDDQDGVIRTIDNFEKIRGASPRAIFLADPIYEELGGEETGFFINDDKLLTSLFSSAKNLELYDMTCYLPTTTSIKKLRAWYQLPADPHKSDYGLVVYSDAVCSLLIHRVAGNSVDVNMGKKCSQRNKKIESAP